MCGLYAKGSVYFAAKMPVAAGLAETK